MKHSQLTGLVGFFTSVIFLLSINPVFGQSTDVITSEQTTLSGDLANNPVAQDILKKIEQTKKWIEELEQRNYEKLEAKKELEAKRAQALEILEEDLKKWEEIWEEYSPRNAFGRFVETISSPDVQGVFWDQFEFHEMKVNAGRAALKEVIANGGSLAEARQAYHKAAETKRIELIEANAQFNVNHNLAYYNQQILFNKEGQFVETPITGEQLRKYYEDYRTNPAYLEANPDDITSWDDIGQTNPDTKCREGNVVVHRFHAKDYVCVTSYTAEMWILHGMGEITGNSTATKPSDNSVTPLTKCNDGYMVIFINATENYSCVIEDTANGWIQKGVAEFHDPQTYLLEQINDKETELKILTINNQIKEFEKETEDKKLELKKTFDIKYAEAFDKSKEEEKSVVKYYSKLPEMTKVDLSNKILEIREQYQLRQEEILQEKINSTKSLDDQYHQKVKDLASNYDFEQFIKIVWNSDKSSYEAVLRD